MGGTNINYNILHYVIAVAEEKNFTEAAKKLYISQPSLSQRIKYEEERLGITIFDRSQNPISLTCAGSEYVLWAKQLISLYQKMENRLHDFSTTESIVLKIGILSECSAFILSNPLKVFREKNPRSYVHVIERNSQELQKGIDNHELDFIVSLTPKNTFKYQIETLYDEQIVLATTPEFLPQNKDINEIKLSDFSESPFIVMTKNGLLYDLTHELCKRNGFVPKSVVECSDLQTAIHMVKTGIGVSIVPDLMTHLVGNIDYYHIDESMPQTQISIIYNKDSYLTRESRTLIELIKKNLIPLASKIKNFT